MQSNNPNVPSGNEYKVLNNPDESEMFEVRYIPYEEVHTITLITLITLVTPDSPDNPSNPYNPMSHIYVYSLFLSRSLCNCIFETKCLKLNKYIYILYNRARD